MDGEDSHMIVSWYTSRCAFSTWQRWNGGGGFVVHENVRGINFPFVDIPHIRYEIGHQDNHLWDALNHDSHEYQFELGSKLSDIDIYKDIGNVDHYEIKVVVIRLFS